MPVYGGIWDSGDTPQRSGLYFNVSEDTAPAAIAPADGVVAAVVQSNWGPVNTITAASTTSYVRRFFGTGGTAYQTAAFALENGASSVMLYRVAGSGFAKASVDVNNVDGDPVLTLTAKYHGTRGNSFTITTREDPSNSLQEQILIYESGSLLESHTFLKTDTVADKVAAINATSTWVDATDADDATIIAYNASVAFIGGNNGAAPTAQNVSDALAAFEARVSDFGLFAMDDWATYSSEIQTSIRTWTTRVNEEGGLFMLVIGGAESETVATALTRSSDADSDVIVNITRDLSINDTTYSSSKLAPMVAGMIAGRGTNRAISLNPVSVADVVNPPTTTQTETLVRGGVVPFVLSDGGITRIQRGRTTFTSVSATKGETFKSILAVRKIHAVLRALTGVYLDVSQLGLLNNDIGQATILGKFQTRLDQLVDQGIANPDYSLILDPDYDNTGETLHLRLVARPAPTVEVVLGTWIIPS